MGLLLEQAGPDDLALVVSDHGFEAGVAGYGTSGGHESEGARYGILFARGRGIPAGSEPGPIGVADIEPTVAAWLGLDLAENLAGKPAPWVDASRSKHVATYETKPIERMPGRRSGVEDALIEKLRSLGYVEDEGGSPHP